MCFYVNVLFVSVFRFNIVNAAFIYFCKCICLQGDINPSLPLRLRYGIFERCRELVEAGFDVRQPDKENVTLLHWAAINNRIDLVK